MMLRITVILSLMTEGLTMEFQTIADSISASACVASVEKKDSGSYDEATKDYALHPEKNGGYNKCVIDISYQPEAFGVIIMI